jgi:4-carboxymuconolactone decarboxylase
LNKRNSEKINHKSGFFHREKPRIPPLGEINFIKEVFQFRSAMEKLEYPNGEDVESKWESEMRSLVQWLKSYHDNIIEDLSSFLKLENESLNVNSISSTVGKDSIKLFIRENVTIFNIIATMMNYRKLRLKWVLMASHVTYDSSLPPRDKEILILRIAWLCGSHYEWNHHVLVGKRVGLSEEEIKSIKTGSKAQGWDNFDKLLLNSVDELYENRILSDTTWLGLSKKYDEKQLMDLIFVIGAYNMLAMFMNSVGFKTEECVEEQLKEN